MSVLQYVLTGAELLPGNRKFAVVLDADLVILGMTR